MNFLKFDLGILNNHQTIEITLTNAANVRLLTSNEFTNYKSGRKHTYYGGLAKRSPITIQIPHSGHWILVIDMAGLQGSTKAAVNVLPGHLPEIRETPLSTVPSLLRQNPPRVENAEEVYDVFVSHAFEDKETIVKDLVNALVQEGLKVWYDDFTLHIGDSLRQKIDKGLVSSRFGLVVLSPSFFSKGWTNYELDGIVSRTVSGEQVLLPIWHNVTKQQVMDFSPSLSDKVARSTATQTLQEIAHEIALVIKQ